jgi:hypothetical protein
MIKAYQLSAAALLALAATAGLGACSTGGGKTTAANTTASTAAGATTTVAGASTTAAPASGAGAAGAAQPTSTAAGPGGSAGTPASLSASTSREAGSPTTTATAAGHSAGLRTLPAASFPAPVRQALAYLAGRTNLPLAGPAQLDASDPLSALTAPGSPDGTATPAPAAGYQVGLYFCQPALGLNDPRIATKCNFAVTTKGSFGVIPEASHAAALAALPGVVSMGGIANAMKPCPAGSPTVAVLNQHVATCGSQPGSSVPATASWTEGEWTIVYALNAPQTVAQAVSPLIRQLNHEFLPAAPGWIGVDEGGDGEHATVAWAEGADVYTDFDYHDAVGAADMAASTYLFGQSN